MKNGLFLQRAANCAPYLHQNKVVLDHYFSGSQKTTEVESHFCSLSEKSRAQIIKEVMEPKVYILQTTLAMILQKIRIIAYIGRVKTLEHFLEI